MYQKIAEQAEALLPELIQIRRDLHTYPEQGWLEMRTASRIAAELTRLGYEVLTGEAVCKPDACMGMPSDEALEAHYAWAAEHGADPAYLPAMRSGHTGVIGILRCGPGPVLAMRFDMDALPITESAGSEHLPQAENFCSSDVGTMHACGHDGHMTIGLGTARMLAQLKAQLSGTIKLIFQPAEEGVRGARSIVEAGHLDDVDYLLGSHLSQSADGACYLCPGMAGTMATTKYDVVFHGKSAHAGMCPETGDNAMLAAATAVLNIHAIPRHSKGVSRINVGVLQAGSGRNIVCDQATMKIEVRGATTEVNQDMEAYARRILETSAAMHGCTVEIEQVGGAASIQCTDWLTQCAREVVRDKLCLDVRDPVPMGGSEDFASMTQRVVDCGKEACFVGIHVPCAGPFHNPSFDFDERALSLGVKFYTAMAYRLLGKGE